MMRLFILVCISLSTCWVRAEQELSTVKEGEKLANELSQKLNTLGSFQATYDAISHDKLFGKIKVLFNNDQKYCLMEVGETNESGVLFILDYSQLNEKSGDVEMLMISGKQGTDVKLSIKDTVEHLDNPVGILCFMAKQLQLETNDITKISIAHPNLSLGLDSSNIMFGAGFLSGGTNLTVSWLDPNICILLAMFAGIHQAIAQNLLVGDSTGITQVTPSGVKSPFAPGLTGVSGMTFDSAGIRSAAIFV
jgi:hypothetical protein